MQRRDWAGAWTPREVAEANLFERDLFGEPHKRAYRSRTLGPNPSPLKRGRDTFAVEDAETYAPPPVQAAPPNAQPLVLKRTQIRLATLGEELEVTKLLDPATDAPSTRARTRSGQAVDLTNKLAEERRAYLRRHRQIHPALASALARAGNGRIKVLVWLYVPEDLFDKGSVSPREPLGPLVASSESEAAMQGGHRPPSEPPAGREPSAVPADPRMLQYRNRVTAELRRATTELRNAGIEVSGDLETVPALFVEATARQVQTLSERPDVSGLFLHEPEGFDDLTDSMSVARATPVIASGWRATNIRVGVWEQGPDVTTDLRIEEFYDTTQAAKSDHARLTTAIIKNRQAGAPHGYAPDSKVYSANSYSLRALHWAVVSKECRVINQSFHRDSEQTDSSLSADDLVKDYLATHYPYPTIVHAAGNQRPIANDEYVNHKGYNSIVVGNHDDSARNMRPRSVFRNPSSVHNDRELPDICANGDNVTAAGVTHGGTSFASPAVAGSVALLQNAANSLLHWPEGCRAILLAAAGRNVRGQTWWDDVRARRDGRDGAGALDTREGVAIARARASRSSAAARRGWDVGTLHTSDFDANRKTRFRYQIAVPRTGARRVRVALAWNSKLTYTRDETLTPPVSITSSELTVDLDLHVYQGNRLVASSNSFDNSYEVVDFQAQPDTTYDIMIRRWSGTDWVWYGLAWTVFP